MNVDQSTTKSRKAENFMRSATAPTISAGVMMANISWNTMNVCSGMFSSGPAKWLTPLRAHLLRFPKSPPTSGPKAIE